MKVPKFKDWSKKKKVGLPVALLLVLAYLVGNLYSEWPGWKLQALRGVDAEVAEAGMVPAANEEEAEVNELEATKAKLVAAESNLATAKAEAEKLAAAIKKAEAAVKEVEAELEKEREARAKALRELDSRPTQVEVDRQVEERVRAAMGGQGAASASGTEAGASTCEVTVSKSGTRWDNSTCPVGGKGRWADKDNYVLKFPDGRQVSCGVLPKPTAPTSVTCTFL